MSNSADPDQKPTDLDLHCLQRQGTSGFSMTRVKYGSSIRSNIFQNWKGISFIIPLKGNYNGKGIFHYNSLKRDI